MAQADVQSFLYVGLGNPGAQYELTRHNIGYLVIQKFANLMGWSFKEDRRFHAAVVKGVIENKNLHLVLPLTYMNLSGNAVKRYMDYFKIPVSCVAIVVDDIALSFGQLRLKSMGSTGGHNGLKSIEDSLGTSHYKRLRMGIGHPGNNEDPDKKSLAKYVLEDFSLTEQQELPNFIDRGIKVLQHLLRDSFSNVMKDVNTVPQKRSIKPEAESNDLTKPPLIG